MRLAVLSFLLFLTACATTPIDTKFDADWEFCKNARGETRACLNLEDVKKLRTTLIRCRNR